MAIIHKAVLGSVRLDSDIWETVRSMDRSLNVYLRETLMARTFVTPEIEKRIATQVKPRKRVIREKGDATR